MILFLLFCALLFLFYDYEFNFSVSWGESLCNRISFVRAKLGGPPEGALLAGPTRNEGPFGGPNSLLMRLRPCFLRRKPRRGFGIILTLLL